MTSEEGDEVCEFDLFGECVFESVHDDGCEGEGAEEEEEPSDPLEG